MLKFGMMHQSLIFSSSKINTPDQSLYGSLYKEDILDCVPKKDDPSIMQRRANLPTQ